MSAHLLVADRIHLFLFGATTRARLKVTRLRVADEALVFLFLLAHGT
jgi:hypothetical protein